MRILSIILGFLLGYALMFFCNSDINYHGPDSNDVKKNVYTDKNTNTCYQFVPQTYICPIGVCRKII